jgi:hypothetical protein
MNATPRPPLTENGHVLRQPHLDDQHANHVIPRPPLTETEAALLHEQSPVGHVEVAELEHASSSVSAQLKD